MSLPPCTVPQMPSVCLGTQDVMPGESLGTCVVGSYMGMVLLNLYLQPILDRLGLLELLT